MTCLVPRSLTNRLFVALVAAAAAILTVQIAVELQDEVRDVVDLMDDLLEIDIEHLADSLPENPPFVASAAVKESYQGVASAGYLILDADHRRLDGVNVDLLPERPTLSGGVSREWLASFATPSGTVWVAGEEIRRDGGSVWIYVMRRQHGDDAYLSAVYDELMEGLIPTAAPLILLMLAISLIIVRVSLKPLDRAAREASAITGRQSMGRLREDGLPSEIQSLVQAINAALDRLDRSLRFQREFTEEVAHELRTPLSILNLQLDRPPDPLETAQLKEEVKRLIRFVEQLLKAAQIDALQIRADETAELEMIGHDVVAQMAPLALNTGKSISLESAGPAAARGHADAIMIALRNLVENALKATPEGGTVTVHVGPGPMLTVRDEGAGIEPERRQELLRRFWQRDLQRPGAGLGLAIVKKTMDAHGGRVIFDDNYPRGAVVRLAFPAR